MCCKFDVLGSSVDNSWILKFRSYLVLKQALRTISYLLISLLTGVMVTLVTDSFENIAQVRFLYHFLIDVVLDG